MMPDDDDLILGLDTQTTYQYVVRLWREDPEFLASISSPELQDMLICLRAILKMIDERFTGEIDNLMKLIAWKNA